MIGTSWLLGGGNPWRTADPDGGGDIVANAQTGLALASLADGPLGLGSPDGSLGQLTLPRGIAVDGAALFVLAEDGAGVYRYDALHQSLAPLPHIGSQDGAPADAPRHFRHASAIAARGGALYVADPHARRVQVFDQRTLALLHLHTGLADPADLAAGTGGVYILERGTGRVLRATPGGDRLAVVVDPGAGATPPPDRIAVDDAGRVYLRRQRAGGFELAVFDIPGAAPATSARAVITDPGAVRDRFTAPLVTMDADGVLTVDPHLLDPCGLRTPLADGVPRWRVEGLLYVADPARRDLRVLFDDGRLRHQFGPFDASGQQVPADAETAWAPADIVALDGAAVILDSRNGRVYAHRTGDAALQCLFTAPADDDQPWQRIAADAGGCLLLWDGSAAMAARFTRRGEARGMVALRSVRALFARPPAAQPEWPGVLLTRRGALPRPAQPRPAWPRMRYRQHGTWTSAWLDSEQHDCHWHVIELALAALPPGAVVRLRSRTSNEVLAAAPGLPASWDTLPALVAPGQPAPGQAPGASIDYLVQSAPGRYLQLQVDLAGNGEDTAVIGQLRVRFPRESLLDYLPALYAAAPEQQAFLDGFLSIVQTTWAHIEREVDTFERYVDPDAVPDAALPWLAAWLDVRLEGTWTPAQNRRLLQAMPGLRRRWGTVDGLRGWVRVYLANLANIDEHVLEQLAVPAIVERFVERRRLLLGDASATLGSAQGLWSPAVERRFQVGVYERLGDIELVSTGDPQTDALRHDAHAFRVLVPAQLVRSPADEAMLRRAIAAQKPAHTTCELVLLEPRLRIGVQSTIALDTIIGMPAAGPLPCPARADAPSRPPYQRLGYDLLLGRDSNDRTRTTRVLD